VETVLDHVGPEFGQLGDLVADRFGVGPAQGVAAGAAHRRLAIHDRGQPLGGNHHAGVPLGPSLPAARPAQGRQWQAAFEVDRVAEKGLGRVGGLLSESGLARGDPPLFRSICYMPGYVIAAPRLP
jgi:hypothetical protein